MINVLLLASNPIDTPRLRLENEVRRIESKLIKAQVNNMLEMKPYGAVQVEDLQELLGRYSPDIVHFSGHGTSSSQLVLEDYAGNSIIVPPDALCDLFKLYRDTIKCVFLNACFSYEQAQQLSQHIDYVVGMSNEITDEAASIFSSAFYRALGNYRSFHDAFQFGVNELSLLRSQVGIDAREIPKMLTNRQDHYSLLRQRQQQAKIGQPFIISSDFPPSFANVLQSLPSGSNTLHKNKANLLQDSIYSLIAGLQTEFSNVKVSLEYNKPAQEVVVTTTARYKYEEIRDVTDVLREQPYLVPSEIIDTGNR